MINARQADKGKKKRDRDRLERESKVIQSISVIRDREEKEKGVTCEGF